MQEVAADVEKMNSNDNTYANTLLVMKRFKKWLEKKNKSYEELADDELIAMTVAYIISLLGCCASTKLTYLQNLLRGGRKNDMLKNCSTKAISLLKETRTSLYLSYENDKSTGKDKATKSFTYNDCSFLIKYLLLDANNNLKKITYQELQTMTFLAISNQTGKRPMEVSSIALGSIKYVYEQTSSSFIVRQMSMHVTSIKAEGFQSDRTITLSHNGNDIIDVNPQVFVLKMLEWRQLIPSAADVFYGKTPFKLIANCSSVDDIINATKADEQKIAKSLLGNPNPNPTPNPNWKNHGSGFFASGIT